MTGLAIVLYLNQTPGQPRERIMRMQVRFMRSLSGLEWEPPDAVTCFAGNRQKSSQSAYLCCFACLSPYKWQARLGMTTIEATGIPVVTLVLII